MSPKKPSGGASPDDEGIADKGTGFFQFASPKKRRRGVSAGCDGFAQIANKKKRSQSANKRKHSQSVNVFKWDGFSPKSQIMNKRKSCWSANVGKEDDIDANSQNTKTPIEKAGYTDQVSPPGSPFSDLYRNVQAVAVRSWLGLSSDINVVLFSQDPSVFAFAAAFGSRVSVEPNIDFT
ncbi:hypothetical protein POM88_015094 [Heracleum sosnowskyi]|uniref:Uncharacterized protein n=1 Tax=Heracleum sosnowskyi TaxID=360622 RepID=A0AAD8IJX0_9APIA|nr:hypothetical protein POM88_015094 [Heracleum sosnowskyi]